MKAPALVKSLAAGLAAAAVVVAAAYWLNRGSQVRLDGQVLKVRTISTAEKSSVAVIDLRIHNPAKALFQVKEVGVAMVGGNGSRVEGAPIVQADLDRLLDYYATTGPRYNASIKVRDRVRENETLDRTVAAAFEVDEKTLAGRAKLVVRLVDADGVAVEVEEGRR